MKADIFFFVTTAAVVILAILAVVALVYLVRILKNVFYISKLARQQSDLTVKDISDFRSSLREELAKVRDRAHSEGEEVMSSFNTAHGAVKDEARRLWGLFTFLLSFFTLKKVFNRRKIKKTYGKKSKRQKKE